MSGWPQREAEQRENVMSDINPASTEMIRIVGAYPANSALTLRDYFAAKAMQALMDRTATADQMPLIAGAAYHIADAMLKERLK